MKDQTPQNTNSDDQRVEQTQEQHTASRRQFLLKMSRKAAYVAPVVVTLAASKTAFASGSGVS